MTKQWSILAQSTVACMYTTNSLSEWRLIQNLGITVTNAASNSEEGSDDMLKEIDQVTLN